MPPLQHDTVGGVSMSMIEKALEVVNGEYNELHVDLAERYAKEFNLANVFKYVKEIKQEEYVKEKTKDIFSTLFGSSTFDTPKIINETSEKCNEELLRKVTSLTYSSKYRFGIGDVLDIDGEYLMLITMVGGPHPTYRPILVGGSDVENEDLFMAETISLFYSLDELFEYYTLLGNTIRVIHSPYTRIDSVEDVSQNETEFKGFMTELWTFMCEEDDDDNDEGEDF